MNRQTPVRGPAGTGERALAPDLARGFMLLFIALANTVWYLWAVPTAGTGTAHPAAEGALDGAAQFFTVMAVDMRSYPMFAFLFGYGMVQLMRRQEASGASPREASALLRRRNLWLMAFGAAHAALLFVGDILGAYGLAGLLLGWLFLRRADRTLRIWISVLLGLMALLALFSLIGAVLTPADELAAQGSPIQLDAMMGSFAEGSYLAAALERIITWPMVVLGQGLLSMSVPVAILLGFLAARSRVLEEPGRHLALLRGTAAVGLSVGWLGGLPLALVQTGVWQTDEARAVMLTFPHVLTGLFCGVGYVALIALIARRIQARGTGPLSAAVAATGKRSLSAYLAQSLVCAPVLTAWGLGLGAHLTSWTMALFAVGLWLATVAGCAALERAGRRGPAEVLLRRLAYRGSGRPTASGGPAAPPVPGA